MEQNGLYRRPKSLETRDNPSVLEIPTNESPAVELVPSFTRALVALALLAAGAVAVAEPLSASQQQVLRDARNSDDRPRFAAGNELARSLAKAGNADAIAFLVELGNGYLLNEFTNNYTGPTTSELEQLVIAHRHERAISTQLLRLVRGYRSRALFDALAADLRGPATHDKDETAQAIVRTDLPIEADLLPLLPTVTPRQAHEIASFLVQRHYAPAEPALLGLLERTPPGQGHQLSRLAMTVAKLGTPESFAGTVR